MGTTQECCTLFRTNPRNSIQENSSYRATYFPSHKLSKLDEQEMLGTADEVKTKQVFLVDIPVTYMDIPVLADLQKLISISSMCKLEAI